MKIKSTSLLALVLVFASHTLNAQITIGSTTPPSKGTILQVTEGKTGASGENSTKGIGLPRVFLQNYNSLKMGTAADPLIGMEEEHVGLIVYNINNSFDKCNLQSIPSGIHAWNGEQWTGVNVEKHILYKQPQVSGALYQPNSFLVVSDGTAASATTIDIPVEKAFAVWEFLSSEKGGKLLAADDFSGNLYADILWQEGRGDNNIVGTPTLSSNNIDKAAVISVPVTGVKGNAVITLSDTKRVRWSWHIWVTDNPTQANLSSNNGERIYEWMDRNLGAVSATPGDDGSIGLHYQWGRKDPVPGYISFAKTMTSIPTPAKEINDLGVLSADGNGNQNSLSFAIANPLTYIYTKISKDWFSNDSDQWNHRWETIQKDDCYTYSIRTAFDPCPAGWRVPASSTKSDQRRSPWYLPAAGGNSQISYYSNQAANWESNKGHVFDKNGYNMGYYPMAGWRYANAVDYISIASTTFSWSATATPLPTTAGASYFFNTGVYTSQNSTRTAGFQVRCVKEE